MVGSDAALGVGGGGPAVLERPAALKSPEKKSAKAPSLNDGDWAVLLYNDPNNKREFVARCLMEVRSE